MFERVRRFFLGRPVFAIESKRASMRFAVRLITFSFILCGVFAAVFNLWFWKYDLVKQSTSRDVRVGPIQMVQGHRQRVGIPGKQLGEDAPKVLQFLNSKDKNKMAEDRDDKLGDKDHKQGDKDKVAKGDKDKVTKDSKKGDKDKVKVAKDDKLGDKDKDDKDKVAKGDKKGDKDKVAKDDKKGDKDKKSDKDQVAKDDKGDKDKVAKGDKKGDKDKVAKGDKQGDKSDQQGDKAAKDKKGKQDDKATSGDPQKQCGSIVDAHRFDCFPEKCVSQKLCEARGCCWAAPHQRDRKPLPGAKKNASVCDIVNVPYCFYPYDFPGYKVVNVSEKPTGVALNLQKMKKTYYPGDIMDLQVDIVYETKTRLRVKITDRKKKRYEVPLHVPKVNKKAPVTDYDVNFGQKGSKFLLQVIRKSNKKVLLDTDIPSAAFFYADQFLQLSYKVPSRFIYGLGEHRDNLSLTFDWKRYVMWTHDHPVQENMNLYGAHPFYLMMEDGGNSHGVFLLNSNAMEVILQPLPAITWRTIGGILDFYIFTGPTPESVVQQYAEVIGTPHLPPYWGLGFHQCRWGYNNVSETLGVVDRIRKYGIPQDVQWNDLDYMVAHLDFTYDAKRFGNLPGMVEELHKRGLHYVIITDPGISSTQKPGSYPPYDVGVQMGIFINDTDGNIFQGKVWPMRTAFPDFTNPRTHKYWTQMIQKFHQIVPVDGLWIDMNEPSNFVSGDIKKGCPNDSMIEHPPYVPAVWGGNLSSFTVCATARQYLSLHYNVHNLYGVTETMATHTALRQVRKKRPFIISRSTFPSQGHYGGHWTGDNHATWHDMHMSIVEILSFNMFGIPLVGADICGFIGNTTPELCQRWFQLGAFYPFSRSHNDHKQKPQDPAAFGAKFANATRKVLLGRYSYLPYFYSLFFRAHVEGGTVARPLFFEFPDDPNTYTIDKQFMLGPAILISPVLEKGATKVQAYIPKGQWYDFWDGSFLTGKIPGKMMLNASLDHINVHLRGGHILPWQEAGLTTTKSRQHRFGLNVVLNASHVAEGILYWDDGDSLDTLQKKAYNKIRFIAQKDQVVSVIDHAGYQTNMTLGNIGIFGVKWPGPTSVQVNGKKVMYKYTNQYLYIFDCNLDLLSPLKVQYHLAP